LQTRSRILLVFVDGVGLGPAAGENPFGRDPTPTLDTLLGGPLTQEQVTREPTLSLIPVDATLGVSGLPQSATGQTALFTGINAAAALGRHVTAFPGPRLRAIIEEHSLFRRVVEAGLVATFANPFGPRYFELIARRRLRASATVCAVRAAGLSLRGLEELERGEAVSWDIVGDHLSSLHPELAAVSPQQAGRQLARLAARHHLTLFETLLPDLVGHGRLAMPAAEVLARLDGLLEGVLQDLAADVTLVVTSDHGNLEDLSHQRHTLNPVPLLACGPRASAFADLCSILEVTPRILSVVGAGGALP
jgi:2,3-bisphosphoglycerate-independent phosphoglycerate mutase